MIYENVQSNTRPNSIVVEELPDGLRRAVISKNVSVVQEEEQNFYQFDEAQFYVPDEREILEEDIDDWFLYASEDHTPPTIEDRLNMLEGLIELVVSERGE